MNNPKTTTHLVRDGMAWVFVSFLFSFQVFAQQGADYYEDALRRFDASDMQGAIIQLKNALQQNPKLLPAQVLLAEAYLNIGQPAAAEVALEEAQKLGADRLVITPKLAIAYNRQFKYKLLLERITVQDLPPAEAAAVLVQRAEALAGLGKLKDATQALTQAERLDPKGTEVKVAQGTLMVRQGNLQAAGDLAEKLVAQAPQVAAAWNLKASVAHLSGKPTEALAAYGKALELQPDFLDALVARAGLLVDLHRSQDAERDIKLLSKYSASDPRAAYLVSLSAARRGDSEQTRKALAEAVAVLDRLPPELINGNPQFLMLGGLAHYGLSENEKALSYLRGYVALQPRQPGVRKLLASILLQRRDYREAIQLLYPMSEGASPDPQVLSMLGSAYLGRKQYSQAAELFEQASRIAPDLASATVGMGMTHLGEGHVEEGIAALQKAFAKDAGQVGAGMVLATLHLRRGESAKAVEILRQIDARAPSNPAVLNQLGIALLANKDTQGAREVFTRAAMKNRNFLPVQYSIVRMDMSAGHMDAARRRLDTILKFNPDHPEGLYLLALLEERSGNQAETVRLLERIRAGASKPILPLLHLADIYRSKNEPRKALAVVQELESVHPDDLQVLEGVGRAYLADGSVPKARTTFLQMSRSAGYDSQALTRIAELLMGVRAFDEAGHALNKALTNAPDYLPAKFMLVELDLRTERGAEAEKRARELRANYPTMTAAAQMLGKVYMARNQPTNAVREFQMVVDRDPSGPNVLALFQAKLAAGDGKGAIKLMQTWRDKHPKDVAAEAALAEAYMRLDELPRARDLYVSYLKNRPKDVSALNNLANVALALNDPGALSYAQEAQKLAPGDPNIADTLGWILVRQGKPKEALPYLRDARLRAASSPSIQFHLGVALHQLGRKSEARAELRGALASGTSFEGKDEAKTLLDQL